MLVQIVAGDDPRVVWRRLRDGGRDVRDALQSVGTIAGRMFFTHISEVKLFSSLTGNVFRSTILRSTPLYDLRF